MNVLTQSQTKAMLTEVMEKEQRDRKARLQEGTETRVIRGEGFTEKEALDDAMRKDEEYYGHGEGYGGGYGSMRRIVKKRIIKQPKPAKKTTVKKAQIGKGGPTRMFIIRASWPEDRRTLAYDSKATLEHKKQSDAINAAKELALRHQMELSVELIFKAPGATKVATIIPERGQVGVWEFTVDFAS